MAPDGATAYRSELRSDFVNRKQLASILLGLHGKNQITVSSIAHAQMAAGDVDMRVLIAMVQLADGNPIKVIDFGNIAEGASLGVPLRYVDLAEDGRLANMSTPDYLAWMQKTLKAIPYHVLRAVTVRLHGTQAALRVEFAAPTPLGIKE